jgi:hypothetical protein
MRSAYQAFIESEDFDAPKRTTPNLPTHRHKRYHYLRIVALTTILASNAIVNYPLSIVNYPILSFQFRLSLPHMRLLRKVSK